MPATLLATLVVLALYFSLFFITSHAGFYINMTYHTVFISLYIGRNVCRDKCELSIRSLIR
jgi:hypothetical protein